MKTLEDVYTIIGLSIPAMHGWCSIEKAERIARLCAKEPVTVGVELGVFGGRSLVALALGCALRGAGQIHGIDPYTPAASLEGSNDAANDEYWRNLDYEAVARVAQETLYRLELMPYARLVRMRSLDVVDFYADGTLDLLHQDANHSEETSCEEVARWAPKIRPGGYWIADDTNWESTQRAQRELVALGFTEIENHTSWKIYQRP